MQTSPPTPNTEIRYALVFNGRLVSGCKPEEAKAAFADFFKQSPATTEELFNQKNTVLKRNLTHEEGSRYVQTLSKMGIIAELRAPAVAKPEPITTYLLICHGKCLAGFSQEEVTAAVVQLFKLSPAAVAKIFLRENTILKRNLNLEAGERYLQRLHSIGLAAELQPTKVEKAVAKASDPIPTKLAPAAPSAVPTKKTNSSDSDLLYALIFGGKIRPGFKEEELKQQFAKLFKLNPSIVEDIFASEHTVLKRGLSREKADTYVQQLRGLGFLVSSLPEQDLPEQDQFVTPLDTFAPASNFKMKPPPPPQYQDAHASREEPFVYTPKEVRELAFEFTGSGKEYFKIWIVNVLLTIITLGIYSPWAKVRRLRYFYGNTLLDGTSFEYLADPKRILIGRVIAGTILVIAMVARQISITLMLAVTIFGAIILPWIIVKSMHFRNHNSAWRGVRFGFSGTLQQAAFPYLLWPMAMPFTLNLIFPFIQQRRHRFLVNNSRFGGITFENDATIKDFYMLFWRLFLRGIGVVFVMKFLFWLLPPILIPFMIIASGSLLWAYYKVNTMNLVYGGVMLGEHEFIASYEFQSYALLLITNTLFIALTLGFFLPFAKVRIARYASEHISVIACGDLEEFAIEQQAAVSAFGGEMGDLMDIDIGF